MKKLSAIALILILLQLSGVPSGFSQGLPTPTTCPTSFSCSITAAGTRPLTGTATDGHPSSIVGVLSFDASSNVSGFLAVNANGTIANLTGSGATCVSGTGGNLGQIDFTNTSGKSFVMDFVTYVTNGGTGLLITDATTNSSGTEVLVGDCKPAPVL